GAGMKRLANPHAVDSHRARVVEFDPHLAHVLALARPRRADVAGAGDVGRADELSRAPHASVELCDATRDALASGLVDRLVANDLAHEWNPRDVGLPLQDLQRRAG